MDNWRDWRTYVANLLFAAGVLSLLFASGEPSPGMTTAEWLSMMSLFLLAGAACFGGMYYLVKRSGKADGD